MGAQTGATHIGQHVGGLPGVWEKREGTSRPRSEKASQGRQIPRGGRKCAERPTKASLRGRWGRLHGLPGAAGCPALPAPRARHKEEEGERSRVQPSEQSTSNGGGGRGRFKAHARGGCTHQGAQNPPGKPPALAPIFPALAPSTRPAGHTRLTATRRGGGGGGRAVTTAQADIKTGHPPFLLELEPPGEAIFLALLVAFRLPGGALDAAKGWRPRGMVRRESVGREPS